MSINIESDSEIDPIENEDQYKQARGMQADLMQSLAEIEDTKSYAARLTRKALAATLRALKDRLDEWEAKVMAEGGVTPGPDDTEEDEEMDEPVISFASKDQKVGRFPLRFRDEFGRDHYHGIAVPYPDGIKDQLRAVQKMVIQVGNLADRACQSFKEKFNMGLTWGGMSPQDYADLSSAQKANVISALLGHEPNSYFVVQNVGKGESKMLPNRIKEENDV